MLPITWRGRGYVVALITIPTVLVTEFAVEKLYRSDTFYQTEWWPIVTGFFISGALVHLLNRKLLGDEYLDHPAKKEHTLFFIDLKYWTLLLPCIGMLVGIHRFFGLE